MLQQTRVLQLLHRDIPLLLPIFLTKRDLPLLLIGGPVCSHLAAAPEFAPLHCIIGTRRILHWAAHNVILEQTCMFDFESLQFIGGMNVGLCQGQKLKSTVLDSQKPDCTSLALSPSLELCCPHWASPACKARSRPNRGKQGPNRGRYISNARSPPLFTKNITIHILANKNPPLPFLLKTEFS